MTEQDKQKREKLNEVLTELSKTDAIKCDKDKHEFLCRIKNIYFDNNTQIFKHYYSDIFPLLTNLKKKENNIDYVGENLNTILVYCKENENENVYSVLKKLWDHTNLEIARINYVTSIDARLDITGKELEKKYDKISKEAEKINEKQNKIKDTVDRINNIYSEFISILGIFSAIVLIYFGGTSIIGNVLSMINKVIIFKSILLCLISGLVIFNIIFMFLYFLSKILDRSISAINYSVEYYDIFERFKLRYPIIFHVNLLFIICIIADVLIWGGVLLFDNSIFTSCIESLIHKNYVDEYYVKYLILIILVVFNIYYIIYYMYCKITKKLIGNHITLNHTQKYDLRKDNDGYKLIYWKGTLNQYKWLICAKVVQFYYNYILLAINTVINLFRRTFLRHKIFTWINVIFVTSYILL